MRFSVDEKVWEMFTSLVIGTVVARSIDNRASTEDIRIIMDGLVKHIRENKDVDSIASEPRLASWRSAYRKFGAKKYRCSADNLMRMVLKGDEISSKNPVVDLYNYMSLRHLVPIGGDDLEKIDGDMLLTRATGAERFVQFDSKTVSSPEIGEIIYRDEKDVLCRRWNWRECEKSKVTRDSRDVMLVIEGLPPLSYADIQEILKELAHSLKRACGGIIEGYIIDGNTKRIEF